jgi:Amt family ammonium transporter
MTQTVNGSIGGLVAITAGCATMEPVFAMTTGLVAGGLVVVTSWLMERKRLDDVVGAVPVHGVGGAWGTLAAGMFQTGNLFDSTQIMVQVIGIAAAFIWALPIALIGYWLIDRTVGLRASTQDEQRGLDFSEHYEIGYPDFHQDLVHKGKV